MLDFELPVGGWFDDFETDRGWTVGAAGDDASSRHLGARRSRRHRLQRRRGPARGRPHAGPGHALLRHRQRHARAARPATNDVDGGKTTLLSPGLRPRRAPPAPRSATGAGTPTTPATTRTRTGGTWRSPATASTWVQPGAHPGSSDAAWQQFSFDLTDYIALTDQVQLRFVASDEVSGSLVEAGVDDFLLERLRPDRPRWTTMPTCSGADSLWARTTRTPSTRRRPISFACLGPARWIWPSTTSPGAGWRPWSTGQLAGRPPRGDLARPRRRGGAGGQRRLLQPPG